MGGDKFVPSKRGGRSRSWRARRDDMGAGTLGLIKTICWVALQ
jgi:hypothetical protein